MRYCANHTGTKARRILLYCRCMCAKTFEAPSRHQSRHTTVAENNRCKTKYSCCIHVQLEYKCNSQLRTAPLKGAGELYKTWQPFTSLFDAHPAIWACNCYCWCSACHACAAGVSLLAHEMIPVMCCKKFGTASNNQHPQYHTNRAEQHLANYTSPHMQKPNANDPSRPSASGLFE